MRASAIVALALLVLTVPSALGASFGWPMTWEETEPERNALDGRGQMNCVVEARLDEDFRGLCPFEDTRRPYPPLGRLVLDDAYFAIGTMHPSKAVGWVVGAAENVQAGRGSDYLSLVQMALDGGNWRRDSGGEMADVITPGAGSFVAMYGWWLDLDGDGVAEMVPNFANPGPANEWITKTGAAVVSYIEPGSRPTVTSRAQPGANDPDVTYVSGGTYRQDYAILFLDGSLARTTTVTTVADALLSPDGEGRPYTADSRSRVDVDRYAVLAEGPVEPLYNILVGEISDAYGAPSLASCPARCQPGPIPLGSSPAAPVVGAATGMVWASYPREWADDSRSSAAGRRFEFEEDFHAWVDLLPRTSNPVWFASLFSGPLAGRSPDSEATMAPGFFTLEAWVGLWKDLNRDGYVGDAGDNPYQGGTRPLPDDYAASGGEFIGAFSRQGPDPSAGTRGVIVATLVPDEDWGPLGVYPAVSEVPFGPLAAPDCGVEAPLCVVREGPIRLELELDDATLGRYAAPATIFMPLGSPGFTVCTEPLWVKQIRVGTETSTEVVDCDTLPRWAP